MVVSLCAVVVQFWIIQSFFQPVDFRWSLTGIVSILFLLYLFAVVAVYSSAGGGLVGCCFIPIAPAFIANVTFRSVALTTGDPIPIWEWSFGDHFVPYLGTAISGAVLPGVVLGVPSFLFGAVLRRVSRIGYAADH